MSIPVEFQLPEDIRVFFKDGEFAIFLDQSLGIQLYAIVGTGPKGTYVDSSEIKPPRLKFVMFMRCSILF